MHFLPWSKPPAAKREGGVAMKPETSANHSRTLLWAGALALAGLFLAIIYLVRFTPYTMVLFLMGGQGLIFLAACCLGYAALSEVRARLRSIVEMRFKAGDIIFRQGDYPDRLYIIGKGEVDVVQETPEKPEVVLTRLGKDQFFGEIGILNDSPRSATVRAATDVEVLSIHRSYFTSLFSYLPVLQEKILSVYKTRTAGVGR